ncbi:MAG: hypothetical protein G01um101419_362 [Parcubacteria group bacterium Gr01-1014_19]|nr:MAG: hypothetical protein G01um101419_362 [Parcubacteria group bacterium Gr01-1014_19]
MKKADPKQYVFRPLSKCPGFVLAKPLQQKGYKPEEVEKLEKENQLMITRKRDGWKLFVEKVKGKFKIYTDGINDITDKLPHIVAELKKLPIPNKTRLVGEGILELQQGAVRKDIRTVAAQIFQRNTQAALDLQFEVGHIKFCFFDVIFWGGEYKLNLEYHIRYYAGGISGLKLLYQTKRLAKNRGPINRKSERRRHEEEFRFVGDVEWVNTTLEEAKKMAVEKKWEGLVLYDRQFKSDFRLDGKEPQRIRGCYKWKPLQEDDFIVRSWNPSETDPKRLKDVNISQIDPATGKEFNCGKFGNFGKQMREQLQTTAYPLVIQLEFESRYPSGKLQSASFMELRGDKKPEHCIASESFSKAELIKDREDI